MKNLHMKMGLLFAAIFALCGAALASCPNWEPKVRPVEPPPAHVYGNGYPILPNPGDAGTIITSLGQGVEPAWLYPTVPESGPQQWTTAFDCDFTTQTQASLASDGTYTICDAGWTKGSSTNGLDASVGPGGLYIHSSASGQYVGSCGVGRSTRNLSNVWMPLTYALPSSSLTYDLRWRVSVWVNGDNLIDGGAGAEVVAIDDALGTIDAGNGFAALRGYYSGQVSGAGFATWVVVNNTNLLTANRISLSNQTLGTSQNVLVLEVPGIKTLNSVSYFGGYEAGWPTGSSLTMTSAFNSAIPNANAGQVMPAEQASAYGVLLGCQNCGVSNNTFCSFGRIRIEYYQAP